MSTRIVFRIACLAALALFGFGGAANAQYRGSSILSEAALRSLGLERAWHTQIQFDASRGRLAGVSQHISSTTAQSVFEVTYPGGRIVFSDRDLDPFHKPLGRQGAKKKAEQWIETWKARTKSSGEATIQEHVVPDVVLVATAQRGMVQCLNGETGRTLWATKVGSVRHPTTEAAINEKYVALINGTTLYMLDRSDGHIVWERRTTHPAGAGPAMSDNLIFVPMINGHVEIFYIDEPRRPVAFFHASGRCLVQPVVFRDTVAWPTDRGNLYIGNSEVPGIRFRITANDKIPSAPTFRAGLADSPPLVFFASVDGNVYSAETLKGSIVNRFSAGEPISTTPVVVRDQVYVVTDQGTLFCAGADDAQERWFVAGINSLLAANFDRVYCLDRNNRLVGIDAASGNRLAAINVGSVDYSFLNTQSDRIYVGTTAGVLQCLRESRQHYPLVHGGLEPKKQLSAEVQQPEAGEEMPAEDKTPVDTNPFDTDPAPAAKPKPKPMPMDEENPFGEPEMKKEDKKPADDENPFG